MVMIKHMISGLGKRFRKFFRMILRLTVRAFAIAGVLGVIAAGFFTVKGYQMYQGAIREQGLEERIERQRMKNELSSPPQKVSCPCRNQVSWILEELLLNHFLFLV